ncbi:MAG: hypothetical protein SOW92_05700 [Kiritimatiellia bacterium]|nr:hypothetical protein [Kiritimatiellia bacterium]
MTAPSWRYFAADDAENPQGVACITDGSTWALAVSLVDAEAWRGVLNLPVVERVGSYAIGGAYPSFGEIRLGAEARWDGARPSIWYNTRP